MRENIKTPWLASYGEVPFYLEYPDCTMCEAVEAADLDMDQKDKLERQMPLRLWAGTLHTVSL